MKMAVPNKRELQWRLYWFPVVGAISKGIMFKLVLGLITTKIQNCNQQGPSPR